MTSSVTPGRKVGLIMPTTPRQLEKAIVMLPPPRDASPGLDPWNAGTHRPKPASRPLRYSGYAGMQLRRFKI
jgi:hypothetical protein